MASNTLPVLLEVVFMTKHDLIKAVQQSNPYYTPKDLTCAVNIIFAAMANALINNERIEIRGWGSFTVRSRIAYKGRNPKSGKVFSIPPRKTPHFKPAKELQNIINGLP
jgi:integration host factor subunit beta